MHTVLVVDDEWAIAEWLDAALSDEGYRVLVASNGRQALDILQSDTADLVITDFMMPLLDGPGLIAALRRDPATAATPIIVMSSLSEITVKQRCAGYASFLHKPFREADLLAAIRLALPDAPAS